MLVLQGDGVGPRGTWTVRLFVAAQDKPMYAAGRGMQDLLDSSHSPSPFQGPRPRGGGRQSAGRGRAPMGRQQVRPDQEHGRNGGKPGQDNNQTTDMEVEEKREAVPEAKEKFMDVVCFNCGDIGHFSTACTKPRCCFICRKEDHVVENCPEWKKEQSVA